MTFNLEDNWQNKSLEKLEKEYWGDPPYPSYLVARTHAIRKIQLNELTHDDVAMMLRQNFSLEYIVPLAIERLEVNILIDEEGEVMEALLNLPAEFWRSHKSYWQTIKNLIEANKTNWTFTNYDKFDNSKPA
jgi:glycine betaine/choline ABC-type transport system substrate-binding protein